MDRRERVIVALDEPDWAAAERLIARLGPDLRWVKVGPVLFTQTGPDAVRRLKERGLRVMVDLKLHDIPETVTRTMVRLVALGADAITVHAQGGKRMLDAAVTAAHGHGTKVWAVTVLTSLDGRLWGEMGHADSIAGSVQRLASLAMSTGCDGVVASGEEARLLREMAGNDFDVVTWGIRFPGDLIDDQRRPVSPKEAFSAGATQIGIGRPITHAADPAARLHQAQELAR